MLLIILSGLPCSGKSQLATRVAKELESNHGLHTIVVDPDKIREMIPALAERFDPKRESFINSLALTLVEEGLKRRNIVISDDLNYYESARHRLIQSAKRHKAQYIIVYLTVSVETALNRNAARGTPIPQETIIKIAEKFDQPGAKYNWDRPTLTADSEKADPEETAKQVLQVVLSKTKGNRSGTRALAPTCRPAQRADRVQQPSPSETLDESTRRILSELFSSRELDAKLSKEVSRLRRTFVAEMSTRSISIKDAESEFRNRVRALMRGRT